MIIGLVGPKESLRINQVEVEPEIGPVVEEKTRHWEVQMAKYSEVVSLSVTVKETVEQHYSTHILDVYLWASS